MRRTNAGLALELLLSKLPNRWLLCWAGEEHHSSPYDCACCMTWPDEELYASCGCICHRRIETMAADPNIRLWLLASLAMDEFPFIASSLEEEVKHQREIATTHKSGKSKHPCNCGNCEDVRKQDDKVRQHAQEKNQPCDCFYCAAIEKADAAIADSVKAGN